MTASPKCIDYMQQLIDTKAEIDFTQGLDLRLMTPGKWDMLRRMKTYCVHFAWDNTNDNIVPILQAASEILTSLRHYTVYVLTNFDSTFEQDVYRVETIKNIGFNPYVMIYDKPHAPKKLKKLARYANNKFVMHKCKSFEEYIE